ncbi:MAG: hypothetical protein FWC34_06235 [Bacteroidetes bacterium]|nr:hypothetical protein [Bacteroidota bacterium]MCL2303331.1 hypothetical protein [Lentimicrobiaceae bacterium]
MNEIKIVVAKKELIYQAPEAFDEMAREQFILTAEKIIHTAAGIDNDNYYLAMTGIDKKVWDKLHFFQRYNIKQLFDFTLLVSLSISKQLLPSIEINGQQFIGYQPGFSNTTWEEFIFADQYVMNGKYKEAAACLYRPQRSGYTGETDRRILFTIYGTNSRMQFFNNIPEAELLAFVLNYKALRKRNLEEKYPFVFSPKAQSTSQNNSTFSWVGIHRDLMGDHFYDETKFYELNVHVILNRLNTVIKENRHSKK